MLRARLATLQTGISCRIQFRAPMNESWFGEHVFEIAVRKSALPAELQARFDEAPIVLPAWDPMGALAD
jgi:aminopeptidase C